MKKRLFQLTVIASLSALSLSAQRTYEFEGIAVPVPADAGFEWKLQDEFSDDFNYADGLGKQSPLFTSKWDDRYNPDRGFRGPGATFWTTENTAINATTNRLEIRATPRTLDGDGNVTGVNCGVVTSKTKVRYPIFMEASIKVANVENSSNFWMLDEGGFNEIDVLEVYGGSADPFFSQQMSTNFHIFNRQGPNGPINVDNTYQTFFQTNRDIPNYQTNNTGFWRDNFHRFGVYWRSPNEITFYIDGKPTKNGNHFVEGRNASLLDGTYESAILQSPIPTDGNPPIDKGLLENQVFRDVFMIMDIESHHARPISSKDDLDNMSKNLMEVEWVRTYKPVDDGSGASDRTRTISFKNRDTFIPAGETDPAFSLGAVVPLDIEYSTASAGGSEEDLNYVAVQVRQLDDNGKEVATSEFQVVVPNEGPNKGSLTYNYSVPTTFENGNKIPTTENLPVGHELVLLMFLSVDGDAGFANADDTIVIKEGRTRSITFNNKDAFIPAGGKLPEMALAQQVSLDITYATGLAGGVEEDLNYVALQVRQVNATGETVATSAFETVVPETAINNDTVTIDYTIPTNFTTGADNSIVFTEKIPTTAELPSGHRLLLLIFMLVDESTTGFANANTDIILTNEGTLSLIEPNLDSVAEIKLYPNPTAELLNINGKFDHWNIYNLLGAKVEKGTSSQINLSNLAKGVYYIILNNNKSNTYKFVKK
ncbi:T9SS type A sorting domain-containing protein [Aquimarina agarilytica]|uniref:T9SS type A sorting domain-containing protein n=1 Tax=Aquimarina agarilytica TaxID=1087449 RepID=UPI0002881CB2|nr:T9SS type A sorting domain-containing protein [Aquimarina agarilytica]